MITRRGFLKSIGGGLLSALALGSYAFAIEPVFRLRLTTYQITPPNWTKGLNLKVALIADVHACNPWMSAKRIEEIVERTNDLNADLILMLGDYSSGMNLVTDYVDSSIWAPILARLKAPLGVYSILGNHDWWEDETAQRNGHGPTFGQKALEANGIAVFENDAVRLMKDEKPFLGCGAWRSVGPATS